MGEPIRLQKFLARAGVASRRASEELIRAGRVRVDGETVTELGSRLDPDASVVDVDGERVERPPARWIMLHKPPGHLCTRSDPGNRPTVYDLLPEGPLHDLFHVGRLDFMSEGLVLLTNEGDPAHRLLHPSSETEKRYEVRLLPPVPDGLARTLLEGVELDDGPASADAASVLPEPDGEGAVLLLTLHEGRNREIRRMMEAVGVGIRCLKRLSFGPQGLGDLPRGEWRELEPVEIEALRACPSDGGMQR